MQKNRLEKYLDQATQHLPERERQESRAELETHLKEITQKQLVQGLSEYDAEAEALRSLGRASTVNTALVAVSVRGFLRGNQNKITLFFQIVLGITGFALAMNARTTSGMVGISSAPFVFAGLPFLSAGILVGRGGHRRPILHLVLVIISLFLALNMFRILLIGSGSWARIPNDPIGYMLVGIEWVVEFIVAVPGVLLGTWLKKRPLEKTAQCRPDTTG